jgi:hypothetical protein
VTALRTYCEVWPHDEELRGLARTLNRVASRARLDEKVTTEWQHWVYIFGSEASSRGPQGLQAMGGADSGLKAAVDYANQNFP